MKQRKRDCSVASVLAKRRAKSPLQLDNYERWPRRKGKKDKKTTRKQDKRPKKRQQDENSKFMGKRRAKSPFATGQIWAMTKGHQSKNISKKSLGVQRVGGYLWYVHQLYNPFLWQWSVLTQKSWVVCKGGEALTIRRVIRGDWRRPHWILTHSPKLFSSSKFSSLFFGFFWRRPNWILTHSPTPLFIIKKKFQTPQNSLHKKIFLELFHIQHFPVSPHHQKMSHDCILHRTSPYRITNLWN